MRHLRKFLRLPATERRLLTSAVLLLSMVKLGLVLLPFHTVRHILSRLARSPLGLQRSNRSSVEKVVWAVKLAGRLLPKSSTCLTQALAAQALLLRRGHPALLYIGATKGEEGKLEAHAWVESGDDVVIGNHELERYTTLVVLEGVDN